jgi:hypothetical protein
MFTIKHIHPSGDEFLHQGENPHYVPQRAKCDVQVKRGDGVNDHFAFERADGSVQILYSGTIFVMNENGKTVARYEMPQYVTTGVTEPATLAA